MFSKLCVFAVVAIAAAQSVADMKRDAANLDSQLATLDSKLKKTEGKAEEYADGVSQSAGSMEKVDDIVTRVETIAGSSSVLEEALDTSMDAQINDLERELVDATTQMNDALESALDEITRALSLQKEDIDGELTTRLSATQSSNVEIKEATTDLTKRLKKHTDCATKGLVYSPEGDDGKGKCVAPEIPAETKLPKVNHRGWTSNDGRDHGYVNERYVEFTKTQDDTYIRVFYHDNFRVHGHGSWARWHVMICDQNGNGCDFCNNPMRLHHWRYSYHQHQWWMNDHWSSSIAGICKSANNRQLRNGKYRLRVYIDHARYDIHTGHNQYDSFMVDEVFKF